MKLTGMSRIVTAVARRGLVMPLLALCLAFAAPALAQSGEGQPGCKKAQGPKPVGVVNSSNGGVYLPGELGFIFKFNYYKQDQLYEGSDSVDFVPPVAGEKPAKKAYERSLYQPSLTIRAGLYKRLDARVVIPWFSKELKRESTKASFTDDNVGLGDITVFGRFSILAQKRKDPFNLAVGLGLKMPTGESGEEDDDGATLPGFLQTGSGSWDPVFEVGAHKVMGRHWFSAYMQYRLTTEGELGEVKYERPDVFKYDLGYAYALHDMLDLQLELNGEVKGMGKKDGVTVADSGGHAIYLSPGIHFKFYKDMHLDLCVPIAIYRDMNGTQLTDDFRIVAKLAIKLDAF